MGEVVLDTDRKSGWGR